LAKIDAAMQREWARIGAAQRLKELRNEEAEILKMFPDLRRSGARPKGATATPAAPVKQGRYKKRRTISPEARKRMAEGMRKYWAKRKAAGKGSRKRGSAKS